MSQEPAGGIVPGFHAGDRLRKARELTGLDQGPFADELGVSRGTVSNYERNPDTKRKPIVMRAWALRAGVSLEWLETGEGHPTRPGPEGPQGTEPPKGADLARLTARKRSRAQGGHVTRAYPEAA